MKNLIYLLIVCCSINNLYAQTFKKFFPKHESFKVERSIEKGMVTYITFSNSIKGPFTSPATILTTDSLFIKMDVTPLGSVTTEYWFDVNENGLIDSLDFYFESETFTDNSTTPPNIDLDNTPGIIVIYIPIASAPSMQVVVKATEGATNAYGIIAFQNPPAIYSLSGFVYDTQGVGIAGAWVWAFNENAGRGDATSIDGSYNIPLDSGTYYIHIEDMFGTYSSFDTMITISGNVVQNFYLQKSSSYIKGFVRDENSNPIPNVRIWREGGGSTTTDSLGAYKLMVPAGTGRFGLDGGSLLPTYLVPNSHQYTIAANDSIVNDSISNFKCYKSNSSITGTVTEFGGSPTRLYFIVGWSNELNSYTETVTNTLGNYVLPVYSGTATLYYGVWINETDDRYPLPPASYADTSYWNLPPGSVANFNIVNAETSFVDLFNGHNIPPSPMWENNGIYNPWGVNTKVYIENNRLLIQCDSQDFLSAIGVKTRKPFNLNNREFRIHIDNSQVGNNNFVSILLSSEKRYWFSFEDFNSWIQLKWYNHSPSDRGWELLQSKNRFVSTIWKSTDITGSNILFQFDSNTGNLVLKIDDNVKYSGPWGDHMSMAYVYLYEFNKEPDTPTPVYFDDVTVGYLGTTNVDKDENLLPNEFKLYQNYPNPFNSSTVISWQSSVRSHITLKIYDVLGREIATLVDEVKEAGSYNSEFRIFNSELSSGIYFYRLNAGNYSQTRKMILLK